MVPENVLYYLVKKYYSPPPPRPVGIFKVYSEEEEEFLVV